MARPGRSSDPRRRGGALAALASAILIAALATSCGPDGPRTHEFRGLTMGTTWSVKVVAASLDPERQDAIEGRILEELERIIDRMSHYEPSSELSRFNASSDTAPFPVSEETAEVVRWALEMGALTDGALDVTVGPLVDAWGFGPPPVPPEPPSDAEIERLLAVTGQEHLELGADSPALRKDTPGLRVDLSSIAKGYAVDRVADLLTADGLDRFLVEIGGELRARGTNEDGEPWRLAVERPQDEGRSVHLVVALEDGGLATSGDYRNYHEVDGRRLSHIIDPRTGRPVAHRLASVSVIAPLCVRADALATALMVLGPDDGFALAERLDLAALFLVRREDGTFEERSTESFRELVSEDPARATAAGTRG